LVAVGATPPKPLKPEDLPLDGKQTFSWPMDPETGTVRDGSRLNKVLLLRLDPEGFDPETKERAAEDVVAYSAVCVHTAATSLNGTPISSCSYACAITPASLQRKEPRWSRPSPAPLPAPPVTVVDGRLVWLSPS
jgi:rieske iron-sulfur protein